MAIRHVNLVRRDVLKMSAVMGAGALLSPASIAQAQLRTTPDQILGPFYPVGLTPNRSGDLTKLPGHAARAKGQLIVVTGRVLNRNGEPVRGARVEIWQANAVGRYAHASDNNTAPVDPDFEGFLHPGDMPSRIQKYCADTDQTVPQTKGQIVRITLEGIALKYRLVLERLEELVGSRLDPIHMVGGGTLNKLLCQFTADATQREIVAGLHRPVDLGPLLAAVMAGIPAAFWLGFFYLMVRHEPEPKQLVIGVCVLGALVAAPLADFVQYNAVPPIALEVHGLNVLSIDHVLYAVLIAGLSQEMCKYAVVRYTIYMSREFDEPMDGIVYMMACGTGFAVWVNYHRLSGQGHQVYLSTGAAHTPRDGWSAYCGSKAALAMFMLQGIGIEGLPRQGNRNRLCLVRYSLHQRLSHELGQVWRIHQNQVYNLLKRLEAQGDIQGTLQAQDKRPSRRLVMVPQRPAPGPG